MRHHATGRMLFLSVLFVGTAMTLLSVLSTESRAKVPFDHFTTGFRLEGAHRYTECESCHSDGVFAGTPTQCDDCHTQSSRTRATWRPPTHLPTTDRCESCHRPYSWTPVIRFDHLEVSGTCSSCHNNVITRGQHPQHIPTTTECDDCHNTRVFR